MLSYSENILVTLTGKSSLNDVSEDELKIIADNYPYFGAAQFLFAKKLHDDNKEDYKNALQKSAIYFTNTLWLNYNFLKEIEAGETNIYLDTKESLSKPDFITAEVVVEEQAEKKVAESQEEYSSVTNESNVEVLPELFSETKNIDDEETIQTEEAEPNERITNLLKEQAAAFENPVEEITLPIEATAYHRIDYFESQGIKLDPEKDANDKLGSQLKRFTDWLKQMKRISPNLSNLEIDAAGESQVQNMAEHSNEPKEIVTEAMAEVLIKQYKPEQAIAIYEKLSFINPSKSAYFAAKIQELKD